MDQDIYNALAAKVKIAEEAREKTHAKYVLAHDRWAKAVNQLSENETALANHLREAWKADTGVEPIPQSFSSQRAKMQLLGQKPEEKE